MAEVIVGVLGGIGIGKSEFIKSMKKRRLGSRLPSMLVTPGGLKVYEESKRVKDLAASVFYPALKHKDRYAIFGAEIAMLAARVEQMAEASKDNGIVIVERIPEENRYVFFENGYRSGLFGDPSSDPVTKSFYDSYRATYKAMRNCIPTPDVFVYLDVDPKVAFERIKSRGRKSEKDMPLEYLTNLHVLYEQLICEILPRKVAGYGDRLLRINANSHMSDTDLKRFHIQIEEHIAQTLRKQGWGNRSSHGVRQR